MKNLWTPVIRELACRPSLLRYGRNRGSITCGLRFIGWVGTLKEDENPDGSYRLDVCRWVQMRVI